MINTPFIRFFCLRLFIFSTPMIVVFAFPFVVLWQSGEILPVDQIIQKQQHSDRTVIVGLAYSNPEKYFKLHSLIERRSNVVVFGNSHVMPFREEFFKGISFYNAAVGGSRLPDFEKFVEHIPDGKEPKVLIAGLDAFFAQPNFEWSQKEEDRFDRKSGLLDSLRILGTSWKNIYRDYLQKKFFLRQLIGARQKSETMIGVEAIVHGTGFRKDGSHLKNKEPGIFLDNSEDYSRLKKAESFDIHGLSLLESFLDECHRRGIYVIGFLPPTRQAVYDRLHLSGYRYWEELPQKLEPLFKKYGFSLYDFSIPKFYGGDESEFYDDFHASDKAYRRVASQLFQRDKTLAALSKN